MKHKPYKKGDFVKAAGGILE